MSLVRTSPAPYHALAAMIYADRDAMGHQKLLSPEGYAKLQLLERGARSFGFWLGGHCVACAGLMPLASRSAPGRPLEVLHYEAWFACHPTLVRRLKSLVRIAQLTLDELPQDAIVTARVAPGWTPGEKLARLLGFERRESDQLAEIWERKSR